MKKNISILISLAMLMTTIGCFGQDNLANMYIKRMVKSLRDPKNVELTYNYSYQQDASHTSGKQEGKAYMQGEQYKVIMNEQETISDAKVIWTYIVDDKEVMVSNANDGTDNTPFKLISTLDRDYTAKVLNTDKDMTTQIQLTNPKGQYKKVVVSVDKNGSLKNAEIYADDGSMLNIEITDTKTNQQFDDAFFTFDEKAHPGVEIIDMR